MRNKDGEYVGTSRSVRPPPPGTRRRWYVLANRTEAVFYEEGPARFSFIRRLSHPEGRLSERMVTSDRPGRGFSSAGNGSIRHALDRGLKHPDGVARAFAQLIAETLDEAHQKQSFTELVLVSEPRFLGLMRAALPSGLRSVVTEEFGREFKRGSGDDFHQWLEKRSQIDVARALPK